MSTTTITDTPEQLAIHSAMTNGTSLMVKAYAGCAKSTTIKRGAAKALVGKPFGALAFNKANATELQATLPDSGTAKSFNALGHAAWGKAIGKRLEILDNKLYKCIKAISRERGTDLTEDQIQECHTLVTAAMQAGLVPSRTRLGYTEGWPHRGLIEDSAESWATLADSKWIEPQEFTLDLARQVLCHSIKLSFAGQISFDDQIYMSAIYGGQFPRFPYTIVDEAQDLNPLNHRQVQLCSAGPIMIVGDPLQAIYAFRGADSRSMASMEALRKEWTHLPLTLTFRCPKVIVERQQHHAPGFTAAPGNALGLWHESPLVGGPELREGLAHSPEDQDLDAWGWHDLQRHATTVPKALPELAILCRNNGPLMSLAFKLIRQGIATRMLGRDIGLSLAALSRKIHKDDSTAAVEHAAGIAKWADHESSVAMAQGKDQRLASITDRAECLYAVIEGGARTAGEVRKAIADLFNPKSARVTLASIHKAKGLEWDLVVHLDPWRIPSKQAKAAALRGDTTALQQELNLLYVLETRTKHTLIHANAEDFS